MTADGGEEHRPRAKSRYWGPRPGSGRPASQILHSGHTLGKMPSVALDCSFAAITLTQVNTDPAKLSCRSSTPRNGLIH